MSSIEEISELANMQSFSLEEQNNKQAVDMNKRFMFKPMVTNPYVLNVLQLTPEQAAGVRIFDEMSVGEWTLQLVHYLESGVVETQHIRGVIVAFRGSEAMVVCKSFPYTDEHVVDTSVVDTSSDDVSSYPEWGRKELGGRVNLLNSAQSENYSINVFDAYEGPVLRVFYFNPVNPRGSRISKVETGKWYISTHKKIDGRMSRWGSPTFGELLNECLTGDRNRDPEFDAYGFDRECCYVLLMCHPETALVCNYDTPKVYHLDTYCFFNSTPGSTSSTPSSSIASSTTSSTPSSTTSLWHSPRTHIPRNVDGGTINHPDICYPTQFTIEPNFTIGDLVKYVNNQDFRQNSGIVVSQCWENESGVVVKSFKLVSQEYHHKRLLRGNEPSLTVRYLQLSQVKNSSYAQELYDMYPYKAQEFCNILNERNALVSYLFQKFVYRHVQGNYLRIPQIEHHFLDTIASLHHNLKKTNCLTMQDATQIQWEIFQHLGNIHPRNIYSMVKNHRTEMREFVKANTQGILPFPPGLEFVDTQGSQYFYPQGNPDEAQRHEPTIQDAIAEAFLNK